ncbi:MAG TPA: hypothetical protein VJB61_22050 [Actinomycetota bacterium]
MIPPRMGLRAGSGSLADRSGRVAPAIGLFFLAPLVGEYLLGNVSIVEIWALPVLALLYGSGAVLIREVARRTGRGWPTMLVLGLAYGLIEAGLIDQTLFKPPELTTGVVGAATYVPALGISVSDLLSFVVGHAGWSIGVPIAMVEALVPSRRTIPWLGRAGLAITGALYLLSAVLVFRFMQQDSGGFLAPAPKLAAVAGVSAALIGLGFAPGRHPRPPVARPTPRAWLVAAVALAASFLFGWRDETWSGVAFGVVVAAATAGLVARWSRRRGWGAAHRLALAGPALLHQAATGFLLTQLYGREGAIHVIANVVFAVGAVALLLCGRAGWPRPRSPAASPAAPPPSSPRSAVVGRWLAAAP